MRSIPPPFWWRLSSSSWGGVEVDNILPRCLGAGLLLGGSGRGLALLGLCHRGWRLVLIPFIVGRVVALGHVVRVRR